MLVIKNGLVYDAVNAPRVADIRVEGSRIVEIAENIDAAGAEVVDASGMRVYPGFVEAHGHIGLDGWGIGYEGSDFNEINDVLTPHLRAIDAIQPFDRALSDALKGGVTCLNVGPGSANVLGGTFACIKSVGKRIDDMCVKKETAMKGALGENPKRCYREKCVMSRMTMAALLREELFKAREYGEKLALAKDDPKQKPAFNMKLEALQPVIRGEMPLKIHAHQANDMFTAIRVAKEFGVKLTLEHCTEGHMIVEELAKENYMLAVGPTLGHATKFELQNKSWITPGVLAKAGCHVSIITDSPVIPQQHLALCAGMAVKAGMDPADALKAITINPAEHIGVAERVGSLEVGKDADILITDGDPFEVSTVIRKVYVNGRLAATNE